MQKHIQHNKDERTQFFRKIYLSLYSKGLRKGYCVKGELETEQRLQHIDPHSSGFRSVSFLFFWAAQPGTWGPASAGSGSHSTNWNTDFKLWSPTDRLPVAPGLYHCLTSTCFLYLRQDAPVIYTGAFLIWPARPGRRSIC